MQHLAEILIPIIFFFVIGIAFISYFYFRSKERQMLIEKGLDAQSIKEFFDTKRDPYRGLKLGIILTCFGAGLGLGFILEDYTSKEYWIPLSMFVITGLGIIGAHFATSKKAEQN